MTDQELIAAFLAKNSVTAVPEGKSVLAEKKAARTAARANRRANREYAEQRREDQASYEALCKEGARA